MTTANLSKTKAALLEKYLRGEMPQRAAVQQGIPRRPAGERVPLSFGQQQVWLLTQMVADRPVYNECFTISLNGPLDIAALERSFSEILRRHEAWRTTFASMDGELTQVIHPPPTIALPVIHLEGLPEAEREAEALRLATEDARLLFDLAQAPLIRSRLIKMSDTEHRLYLVMHHVIFDGVSIYDVFLPEMAALYGAFSTGAPSPLSEPVIQYADFAHWQRQRVQEEYLAQHMPYWRQLLGDLPVFQLPTDHPRPAVQTFSGTLQRIALTRTLTDALKDLSRREGVTLYMTLVAAVVTLLHRYAGQDDVVIGTATGSRDRPEIEKLMGYFVNTLALRTDLADDPTFRETLLRVRRATLEAQKHRDVPFELVVRELHPQRNFTQNPLFQVLFTFEPPLAPLDVPWSMSQLDLDVGTSKFDLSIELDDRPEGIIGRFEYSTDLFEAATITRMIGHFQTLLQGIVADPGRRLSELPLLTEPERHQMLVAWNATEAEYPRARQIHEMFEDQVAHAPDAIAAVFADEQITYRALSHRANQVAHYLQARGVGPDVLVGICVERSLDMLVGVLAVLKAGGAYVPLDPAYPRERLAFMLEDAQMRVLLTQQRLAPELPVRDAEVICLDRDRDAIARHSIQPPVAMTMPESLAYVIYTSGSTGKPKGVMITHGALMNFLWSMRERLDITDRDVMLAVASLSFDMIGLDLFLPLLVGARVVIVPQDMAKHGRRLAALIGTAEATMMQATPTAWRILLESGWQGSPHLHILSGGEALSQNLAAQLLLAGKRLTNLYGPTETTIYSAVQVVEHADAPIPLGRPIANTHLFLLDRQRQPVPLGVPGELYIGGDGVARGYLNRPELTAERFVPNPFSVSPSARMYMTGDRARYLPDGTLEFLGRGDNQVKVRGFRIELGEIETLLERHAGVQQAVVMAREDVPGSESLAAYIVPAREPAPTVSELRQTLAAQLPDYMLPSAFVLLDTLPMTPNGKVDRRALPAPSTTQGGQRASFVAPNGILQLQLARIWEEVLDVRPIGITDDFFELGGTSLLAARLVDRILDVCGQALPLATFFSGATIEHLEEVLLRQTDDDGLHSPIARVQEGKGKQPFFFLYGDLRDSGVYCVKLARALDPDRPFYAIHPSGTNGKPMPYTLEAIAADHVEALRAIQPNGPYLLGGFCGGASVAFEMAQQLQAQGERVDALAMIEQGVAHAETRIARTIIGRLGDLFRLDREKQVRLFLHLRRAYMEKSPRALLPDRDRAVVRAESLWIKRLERLSRFLPSGFRRMQPFSMLAADDPRAIRARTTFDLECRYMWAITGYTPRRYRGRVAAFWARDEHAKPLNNLVKGWEHVTETMDVYATPGTHFSSITTHAEALAGQMRAWLDDAEAPTERP